ncbi:hypothetical protein [Streptosporangium sp. KLBMP 9127]|nr:hypothetical protein [Streptosporangium sp. KLBMP 9127]
MWDADNGHGRRRSGVTGFRHRAVLDLFQTMCGMPDRGAAGTLRAAMLDCVSRAPLYIYSPVLMRMGRDERTGGILVEGGDV